MYRLKLLVADHDSQYVDRVTGFINANFASRFRVMSFTKPDLFEQCLAASAEGPDIMLAHPDFLFQCCEDSSRAGLMLQLADTKTPSGSSRYKTISKYLPGDKLVGQLLDHFTEAHGNLSGLLEPAGSTGITAVYSPAGGTGKTSIALGTAAALSHMGKKVLVLGLECINSIQAVVNCTGTDALTYLLLTVADKSELSPAKLEDYTTTDPSLNIDFLEPPHCFLELSELTKQDLRVFLGCLKKSGLYDFIIIDMDSAVSEKTFTVFDISNKILFVQTPDEVSRYKTEVFLEQAANIGFAEQTGFLYKTVPVINKYSGGKISAVNGLDTGFEFFVPLTPNLWSYDEGRCIFDFSRNFRKCCTRLAESLANDIAGVGGCAAC